MSKKENNLIYTLKTIGGLLLLLSVSCIFIIYPDILNFNITPPIASSSDLLSAGDVVSATEPGPSTEPEKDDNISDGNYTEEQMAYLVEYFSDSMFVGDSVLLGFKNYARKFDPPALDNTFFYGAVGYSASNSCSAVTEKSIHPTYGGQQMQPYYVAKYREIGKVFLVYGHNDLAGFPIDKIIPQFDKLISRFKRECPDIEIYIVSTMYVWKGTDNYELNNENVELLNQAFKEYCENDENGYGAKYIELASYLGNPEEGIDAIFSLDKYCHINEPAYEIWVRLLCDYALGLETPEDAFDEQKQALWNAYEGESEETEESEE